MNNFQKLSVFLLRISMGWFMFYAGITKVQNAAWSAAGYIEGAKTFPEFYQWFLQPDILPAVNILNAWGILLIGIALLTGVFVRAASFFGIALMLLFYFPILDFPHPNAHAYLVDDHIIYALGFFVLMAMRAGSFWGLGKWCSRFSFYAKIKNILG